jgi:hypothetical protein
MESQTSKLQGQVKLAIRIARDYWQNPSEKRLSAGPVCKEDELDRNV